MLTALTFVLAQAAQPTLGFGAARPAECGLEAGATTNFWERAKSPQLRSYCDLLARGSAKLVGLGEGSRDTRAASIESARAQAQSILAIADEADKLVPRRAAPWVLKGRALLRLGQAPEALAALKEAKSRDERCLDDAVALLAWARANARSGNLEEAARAFRAALPRGPALPLHERGAAAFEAGMTLMALGPATLDDAVAMLRQARRDAQDELLVAAVVAQALALDRAGQTDDARAVLVERIHVDPRPVLGHPQVREALADAGASAELEALEALALEAFDPAASRDAWRRYADAGGGDGRPWVRHARAHEAGAPRSDARHGRRGAAR